MKYIRPPILIKCLYGSDVTWNMPSHEKVMYLTFDDGPVPDVTPEILYILKKYKAKATFFHVGENVKQYPDLYKKLQSEGHISGNHTLNHLNGWKTKTQDYVKNVEDCSEIFNTSLFRPPFGKIRRKQIQKLKRDYRIIMWSALSYDFDIKTSPQQCYKNVVKNAGDGSIIVFHDSIKAKRNVLYTLPKILNYFSEQGYQFKTIPLH